MRMAIIEIVGALIKDLAEEEESEGDAEKKEKRINALFELLFERMMDLNSYVRAKVLNTLSRLCEYVPPPASSFYPADWIVVSACRSSSRNSGRR